jgi:hypothetical protein
VFGGYFSLSGRSVPSCGAILWVESIKYKLKLRGCLFQLEIVGDELMPNGFPKIPSWMPNVFDSWVNSRIACTWLTEDHQGCFDLKSYVPIRLLI